MPIKMKLIASVHFNHSLSGQAARKLSNETSLYFKSESKYLFFAKPLKYHFGSD